MSSPDELNQRRAALAETTQSLLLHLEDSDSEYLRHSNAFAISAHELSKALLEAGEVVSLELGEAYQQEGSALPSYVIFLVGALDEYRKRKRSN